MCSKYLDKQYGSIQGCGAVTFLVGSGSGSGSEEVFRLRLRCSSPHMSLNQQYDFQNCQISKYTSYWLDLEFECYFEWVPLKFVTHCHPTSVADTGEVTNSSGLRCRFSEPEPPRFWRLRLRLRLRENRFGGSDSGSGSDQNVSAPAPHPWFHPLPVMLHMLS